MSRNQLDGRVMHSAAIAPTLYDQLALAEQANAQSRALLRKILPDFVIDRLMARPEESIADEFPDASVLFADIEGFVSIARKLGGQQTVGLLDNLTREFDALAVCHGVEKIKTIGDGYMAVAGVPQPRRDHCERLARLALDMLAVVRQMSDETGLKLRLRIGIAAGPVMAGVIGGNKFSYDVWGDTVNLAARLERQAQSGQILISSRARAHLAGRFHLSSRRRVNMRGLGLGDAWGLEKALVAPAYAH
jgi:adenylate cyclase